MKESKEYLKKHGIVPNISFKDTPKHTFTVISDKIDTIKGNDGKDVEGVRYLVEENGEKKSFFTSSVGLIQRLAEVPEKETVTVEMKSAKRDDGQWISYYEVVRGEKPVISIDTDKEDIKPEDLPF